MSDTKFTPGPWSVSSNRPLPVTVHANGLVASIDAGDYARSLPEGIANAHLIAAAPELYAALEQAVTSMQDSGYQNSHISVIAARAALSKARGESQ